MSNLSFEFAPSHNSPMTTINDPSMVHFYGQSVTHALAREAIQNIVDAHDPKKSLPVEASFTVESRKLSEIPNINSLKESMDKCRKYWKHEKEVYDFYSKRVSEINRDAFVNILKISDYNTVGLTGDDNDPRGNYFLLMKTEGGTSKGSGEGGSWGLGKAAYFNSSNFHTFFASSVHSINKTVFQGRTDIPDYKDQNGESYNGSGSYGLNGQLPVRNSTDIPSLFQRSEMGTDIFILEFNEDNWEKKMIMSILNFFWYPLLKNRLKVDVGKTTINSNNIEELLYKYFDEDQEDSKDQPNPIPYFKAYVNPTHKRTASLKTLGAVQLYLIEREKYPGRVAYMRKPGMVVMKRGKSFFSDYAAVFICEDIDGNEILRYMENPQHDEWNKNYAKRKISMYDQAVIAESELNSFVNESFNNFNVIKKASVGIPDLENFIYLEEEDVSEELGGGMGTGEAFASEDETVQYITELNQSEVKSKKDIIKVPEVREEQPGEFQGEYPIVTDQWGGGEGEGGHRDPKGHLRILVPNLRIRSFCTFNKGRLLHVIRIKGKTNKAFYVECRAGTDDSFEKLQIADVKDNHGKNLKFEGSRIHNLVLSEGNELELLTAFDINEKLALNIQAYYEN